jgi:enediyne biosynthesis protein E4
VGEGRGDLEDAPTGHKVDRRRASRNRGPARNAAPLAARACVAALGLAVALGVAAGLRCAHAQRVEAPAPAQAPGAASAHEVSSAPTTVSSGGFRFVDVAAASGLTRPYLAGRPGKDHLLDSAGAGLAFLDADRDGRLDIYLPNGWRLDGDRIVERGVNALYRGLPDGTFRDITAGAGVGGEGQWGTGVVPADYDGDGWTDLLVTSFGRTLLYRNLGEARFENVAARAGVETPGWNTGASFFDADGDGDLDLYIAAYIDCSLEEVLRARPTLDWKGLEKVAFGPFGLPGAPDHFYRQENGRFVDATAESGMTDQGLGFGFAVRAGDFDGDGDLDLYVANDSDPNYLYRNEGNGRFREIGVWSGCALDAGGAAQASMGIAAGDAGGTGRLDLVVTNFAEDFTTYYRNLGDGFFEDASEETGVGPATWKALSWGTAFADVDSDGDLDLVIANGHIYPQIDRHPEIVGTYAQRNLLLENRGGIFADVTAGAGPGFQVVEPSRGLAIGDYDNDGDLDILIGNLDAPPTLLRNDTPQGAWITVVPEGPHGGPPPPGTKVTVRAGDLTLERDVAAGDSYAGSHDPRLHFGLGGHETADSIEVRWPDGVTRVLRDVAARRFLAVERPR